MEALSYWEGTTTQVPRPIPTELQMDALFRTYRRRVYKQCFRMLRNEADAEDLTQEVFLRLLQKAHTFRGESRFSTWLHRLTRNLVLMELRKQRRRPTLALYASSPAEGGEDHAADHELEKLVPARASGIMDRVSLNLALAQLPAGYRQVFALHDEEGYGHLEIARFLGVSPGTSKSQLHKARFRLRALIQNDGEQSSRRGHHPSSPVRNAKQRRRLPDNHRLAAA